MRRQGLPLTSRVPLPQPADLRGLRHTPCMAQAIPAAASIVQSLSGHATLLMKMRILSLGKNYDVMDTNQNILLTIGMDAGQNVKGQLVGAAVGQLAGDYV